MRPEIASLVVASCPEALLDPRGELDRVGRQPVGVVAKGRFHPAGGDQCDDCAAPVARCERDAQNLSPSCISLL